MNNYTGVLSYLNPQEVEIHHHAIKMGENKYYHFFVIDGYQFTTITEGEQAEAMKKALLKAIDFHGEKRGMSRVTYSVISNVVDIATTQIGDIVVTNAKELVEIKERVRIELEEKEKEERRQRRERRKAKKKDENEEGNETNEDNSEGEESK